MRQKSNSEIIGEIIGDFVVIILIAWALVSTFTLTWGQSFVISWLFSLLRDSIRNSNK
jgi:hypothetical protein